MYDGVQYDSSIPKMTEILLRGDLHQILYANVFKKAQKKDT